MIKPTQFGAKKPDKVLLTLDYDDTICPQTANINEFQKTDNFIALKEILGQNKNLFLSFLNTGRNFEKLQAIIPLLISLGTEFCGIAIKDGKELCWKPKNKNTAQWLNELQAGTKPELDNAYRSYIWDTPLATIKKALEDQGYYHAEDIVKRESGVKYQLWRNTDNPDVTVHWKDDESYLRVFATDKELRGTVIKDLGGVLCKKLKVPVTESKIKHYDDYDDIYIPVINKKFASDYVKSELNKRFNIFAEVRAGDAINDKEMLTDPSIYAIQVGENPDLQSLGQFRGDSKLPLVKTKSLAEGIQAQVSNIRSAHPE